ncbi:hypothetical protein ACF3DV_13665 [Chlorogloeopsis fritschii PCC 9212]|uniref:Glycosyl transferase n=1 Tax=Chlorogloeopsis fritschii PCC 6912 TaxID=211165 RepID=A0A3S0ZYI2_CHLFR|nr:hypothetical protein [Chlorogloeopsis fritschii]RUR86789.1 hypothetical protein PCC6912_02320 [Chlorogloeopsis fritschii PCC 6912]
MKEKIVCTIITKSYLAHARALANSLTENNPDIKLYVLLADQIDGYFDPEQEPFNLIRLEDLPDQQTVQRMCFYYTPFELCCALRGMLHKYIYENELARLWLFLDSDIIIYNSLEEIFQQLETTSILLNPHLVAPINHANYDVLEVRILGSGVYNAGFLGIKRTDEAGKFIEWFNQRLSHYAFQRRGEGEMNLLFVDQLWLNLAPTIFKEVALLVHPGANVGYWSLVSNSIYKKDSNYFINDKPVLFIHFTGWDISQPSIASKYLPSEKNTSIWEEIGNKYKKVLLECDYEECKKYPYAFNLFSNGKIITPAMRYFYYKLINKNSKELQANHIEPFKSYDDLYFGIYKEKIESFLCKVLRIYEYDYLNAKLYQKFRKPIINEILNKFSRFSQK